MDFLPYAHQSINAEDVDAVSKALTRDLITRGPEVDEFEQAIASYCGAQYAVAFNSGTSALIASCYAADLGPNDRLISTANTYIGTISGGFAYKAKQILVDIDLETGSAQIDQLLKAANQPASRGKAVLIPVHFAGIPLDIENLEHHLTGAGTVIIEDAAHAIGSRYSKEGPRIGSCAYSHMTVFSFHPAKTITTGEGGMVTTNDPDFFHRLKLYRNNCIERDPNYLHGEATLWYYEVHGFSNNLNVTSFQAALGLSQLKRLESFIDKRRSLVQAYREQLKNHPSIRLLTDRHDAYTAFHLFVVQINFAAHNLTREEAMQRLKQEGIGTQVHYIPLYRHPYCREQLGDLASLCPNAETYYGEALTLPLFFDMTLADVERVASAVKNMLK